MAYDFFAPIFYDCHVKCTVLIHCKIQLGHRNLLPRGDGTARSEQVEECESYRMAPASVRCR